MSDQTSGDYGRRDSTSDRYRRIAFAVLLAVVIALEFTLGHRLEAERVATIAASAENWAIADLRIGHGERPLPPKRAGVKRLIYVSNSHAKTGGHVARHLQVLLDRISPDKFEVLDIAEPGIFAPDILQRTLRGLDYQPDLVILNVSYITFADRMRPALQAHSVRSFFNDGIFTRLPIGFWLRNYDIGLFGDTLVSRFSALYRNRNAVRDLWEQPLTGELKRLIGDPRPVWTLEFSESTGWRFPNGYDNNLFQWSLYAANRHDHLAEIRALVNSLAKAGVPLLALNLPIDLSKSTHSYDFEDFLRYQQEIRQVFADGLAYVDYEEFFPKDFSTYDALHPTWHGARLHAFDLLLRLAGNGFFEKSPSQEELLAVFNESDEPVSMEYQTMLDGNYPPHEAWWTFRRFDPSEPKNARDLMRRLSGIQIGSHEHQRFIRDLSLRIRYWRERRFLLAEYPISDFGEIWKKAFQVELGHAQKRMLYFQERLVNFEHQRLKNFPLPELTNAQLEKKIQQYVAEHDKLLIVSRYGLPDGHAAFSVMTSDEHLIALGVNNIPSYYRVDILGDSSFLGLYSFGSFLLPPWVTDIEPRAQWGI